MENALTLQKHEQDFDFFQKLASGKVDAKRDTPEVEIKAKIDKLREQRTHLQQEDPLLSSLRMPAPSAMVSEIPKKRSNTLTNYASDPTTAIDHDALFSQILQLEEKMDSLQSVHLKTQERLFLSTLLSIKMTLSQKGENFSAHTPASDLFEELGRTEIPEEFWPQWIQHRILEESDTSRSQLRPRTSTTSSVESTSDGFRKVLGFFDIFRSSGKGPGE